MKYNKPIVVSIAGFDPTGGAGVLADVKTFEQNNAIGMAVSTAITGQNENEVFSVSWLSLQQIMDQIEPIFDMYAIAGVKIGMIQDFNTLSILARFIKTKSPETTIVWDPIKASSSGMQFLDERKVAELSKTLENIDCITPNLPEYTWLTNLIGKEELYAVRCIYLKGGHDQKNFGVDKVFLKEDMSELFPDKATYHDKHGTGCILSSALLSWFVQDKDWLKAGEKAKRYIEKVTGSNKNRLAYHVE